MTTPTPMLTEELVRLDVSLGSDKTETIRGLARLAADAGRTGNPDGLAEDALAREATSATGLPGGIAIPHCRTEHVDVPTLVFARLSPGTDFGAKDGPADLAFLIAAPAGGDATHLEVLTQLARALVRPDFTDRGCASGSHPATAWSSRLWMRSHSSWRALDRPARPPPRRTRTKRPPSFSPSSSKWTSPASTAATGSSPFTSRHVPRSQTMTSPPPYSPAGITPSKSMYSIGWVWCCIILRSASRVRPARW